MKPNERKNSWNPPGICFFFDKTQPQPSNINKKKKTLKLLSDLMKPKNEPLCRARLAFVCGCWRPPVISAPLSFAATTNGNAPVPVSVCCLLEAFCNWSAVLNPLILMDMWVFSTLSLVKLLAEVDHRPNQAVLDVLDTPGKLSIKRNLWPQENRDKVGKGVFFPFKIFYSDLENVTLE